MIQIYLSRLGVLVPLYGITQSTNVIGVRTENGVIAYRDALWVKSSVYGNTDQFPAQILENEGE